MDLCRVFELFFIEIQNEDFVPLLEKMSSQTSSYPLRRCRRVSNEAMIDECEQLNLLISRCVFVGEPRWLELLP